MDNKKVVKDFIDYVFDCARCGYLMQGDNAFRVSLINDPMAYLIADKGVNKRLEKRFLKEMGLKVLVMYELNSSMYQWPDGLLTIKVMRDFTIRESKVEFARRISRETQLGIEEAMQLVMYIPDKDLPIAINLYDNSHIYQLEQYVNALINANKEVLSWPTHLKTL